MADPVTLLPPNATPWMRAVEAASAPSWPTPFGLIGDFLDPLTCPEHMLASLAFENSVDIWPPEWSETKKRAVIGRSNELHRLKGTVAGITAYVEIAGGRVRRVTAPPQGIYAETADQAERAEWLSRFPELRIFTNPPWATNEGDEYPVEAFAGGDGDDGFYAAAAADGRIQARAGVLIRDGVEIPVSRRETIVLVDGVEHLVESYSPSEILAGGIFTGEAFPDDFADPSDDTPILTLGIDLAGEGRDRSAWATVSFQGPFLDSAADRVRQTVVDPAGTFIGADFLDAAYLDRGVDPATMVFDRWRLADPHRSAGAAVPGEAFFGDQALLGLRAFTLMLDIDVDDVLPAATAVTGGFVGDFIEPHDSRKTDLVIEAIQSAAADRDTVLVNFARHRLQRLGDRPTLPLRLGQLVADY